MLKRYLIEHIQHDLTRKMVFVGGPRQVGKTTVAKSLLINNYGYLNWDIPEDRERILRHEFHASNLWVFDEIHKYKSWRNLLKGIYDKSPLQQVLVTGSARLDYYRYSGDSLQGRYYYLRLHPLSFAELAAKTQESFMDLLMFGGFPEPFFSATTIEAKRWSREYRNRLIREDLVSLERVHDVGRIELLALRLPELVGSPLSINALREDLQLSHKTVSLWLQMLERLYAIFRVSPFGASKIRAVKKEQKHYHLDWTVIEDLAKRFENLVACAFLKWVHFRQDVYGEDLELRYFRDVDGREVDFVIINGKNPIMFVECKWNDAPVSAALKYLKTRFPNCEAWQISAIGTKDFIDSLGIRVAPSRELLAKLV